MKPQKLHCSLSKGRKMSDEFEGAGLLKKVLEVYGMTIPELSRYLGFPKTTMHTWMESGKISNCDQVMLKLLLVADTEFFTVPLRDTPDMVCICLFDS